MMLFGLYWEHAGWLWLLPVVVGVLLWGLVQPIPGLGVSRGAALLRSGGARRSLRWPLFLEAAGLMCLVVAMARPQRPLAEAAQFSEGIDMVLAMDVSYSMEAVDPPPDGWPEDASAAEMLAEGEVEPRIEVARQEVARFVRERESDRIGLLAFASYSYTITPPTLDHDYLLANLRLLRDRRQEVEGEMPRANALAHLDDSWTNLAAPLATGTDRLRDSTAEKRVLVLFTDGRNTVRDETLTPRQAARLAERFDVIVYTVGIGSSEARLRLASPTGMQWRTFPADYDPETLRAVADATGGKFFMARDREALAEAMREIDELTRTPSDALPRWAREDLFRAWLCLGLGLVLLGIVGEHTRWLITP